MSNINRQIANLTHLQKEALLKRLKAADQKTLASNIEIRYAENTTNTFPLSFAQQRLWFFEQLHGASASYNIPFALRLKGDFHQAIFLKCLNEIIKRHAILRTRFISINDEPRQYIEDRAEVLVEVLFVQEENLKQFIADEANKPFNLTDDPLMRVVILVLSEHDHVVLFTMHHLITDGWSMGILVRELTLLYTAYLANKPSPLKTLSLQYGDYALWQREFIQADVLENLLSYWKVQLENLPPFLALPADRCRPPKQSFQGDSYFFTMEKSLLDKLTALARQENATLFMVLLTAFYVLLAKYTNQLDLAVGTTIANRTRKEEEDLIGFFVNTLVIRAQLSYGQTFQILLENIKKTLLESYAHQELPFELLVKALQPERNLTYSPLFQVMFQLQDFFLECIRLPNLEASLIPQQPNYAKFDLTLSLEVDSKGLGGLIEFNTDIFEKTSIIRLSNQYQALLKDIVSNPTKKIADLQMITETAHEKLPLASSHEVSFSLD